MCWSHASERAVDPQGKGQKLAFESAVDCQMLRVKGEISAGWQPHF